MALIMCQDKQGKQYEKEFKEKLYIGENFGANRIIVKSSQERIKQLHAVILQSNLNRFLLLVALSLVTIKVNNVPVVTIHVLQHGDTIRIGHLKLKLWEIIIREVQPDDTAIGKVCPVCTEQFVEKASIIICPRCGIIHHHACWFSIPTCAKSTCSYPIQTAIINTLAKRVKFERKLAGDSRFIEIKDKDNQIMQHGTFCAAGNRRDTVPFQVNQTVLFCPECQTPYHLECWLNLRKCPICDYNIDQLIKQELLVR